MYDLICEHLGVTESFELPGKLMACLLDDAQRVALFDRIAAHGDLDRDYMSEGFESRSGDRKDLKQDFTPHAVGQIIAGLMSSEIDDIADICAGTGALSIAVHSKTIKMPNIGF